MLENVGCYLAVKVFTGTFHIANNAKSSNILRLTYQVLIKAMIAAGKTLIIA